MFELFKNFGVPAWLTDTDHFEQFLSLAFSANYYGEIWLYNNDLNVITSQKTFKSLYCNRIFGDLWDKIDAVKILVREKHKRDVFGPGGIIPEGMLRDRIIYLSKIRDGQGLQKLKSFFFGTTPKADKTTVSDIPPEHTLVFYLHQSELEKNKPSGIIMVRPHAYPFWESDDPRQYAIVWQMIDQSESLTNRLLRFNAYFNTEDNFHHIVMDNGIPKLSPGWSDVYETRKHERGDCVGLSIGEPVDYLVLASMDEEIRYLEQEMGVCFPTPLGKDFRLCLLKKSDKTIKIVLSCTGKGNLNSAIKTWEAIRIWKPTKGVILFGVAGGDPGDKNLSVGDLIIGEAVLGYEHAKVVETPGKTWDYEPGGNSNWRASDLKNTAERLSRNWNRKIPSAISRDLQKYLQRSPETIRVLSQHIASGNKLIVSESYFLKLKKRLGDKIKAVEMEGDGAGHACNMCNKSILVIRAVMDKCTPDSRGDTENNVNSTMAGDVFRENIRRTVSRVVARFVHDLLIELG